MNEATVPVAIPIDASSMVFQITANCTRAWLAPSAMRIPISWVRCDTEYEITP